MDIGLFAEINYQTVLIATFVYYLLGIIWYSKFFFGTAWRQVVGLKDAFFKGSEALKIQVLVLFCQLLICLALATLVVLTDSFTFFSGLFLGAFVSIGFIATSSYANIALARWPTRLWGINTSYHIIGIIIMSIILSLWR